MSKIYDFSYLSFPVQHLDFMIRAFWRKRGGYLASKKIVVLDSLITKLLSSDFHKFIKTESPTAYVWHPLLFSYIEGTVGDRNPVTMWFRDVQTVYTTMNWGYCHWVGLVICLATWHIDILDPCIKCTNARKVSSYMAPLVTMLPHLIMAACEEKYIKYVDATPFSYSRLQRVAQNTRIGDCGAYVMKLLEMHSHKVSVESMCCISDEMVGNFRMQNAVNVYEEFVGKLCP